MENKICAICESNTLQNEAFDWPIPTTELNTFSDVVEGQRKLVIDVAAGMIHLNMCGGRSIAHETFRLDSEDVDSFIETIKSARKIIHPTW